MDSDDSIPIASSSEVADDSTSSPVETPRLRIHHLLLWTLCTSASLTVFRHVAKTNPMPEQYALLQDVSILGQGIVGGALVAGMIVMIASKVRFGLVLTRLPGHWIVLVSGIEIAAGMVIWNAIVASDNNSPYTFLVLAGNQLIPACGYLLAARSSHVGRWRGFFSLLFLNALLYCVQFTALAISTTGIGNWLILLMELPAIGELISFLWLIVLALLDQRASRHRDWLHWVGVIGYLCFIGIGLMWRAWSTLFPLIQQTNVTIIQ